MRTDRTIVVAEGREVGVCDYGSTKDVAVFWCHGGPGSRLEPAFLSADAAEAGLRLVGFDRPGYGLSQPRPGRTIPDVVSDLITVSEALEIERFVTVGVSTGGAYALAAAALHPGKVLGVVSCCSMTDMRFAPARSAMSVPHCHAVWDAPNRPAAISAAVQAHGEDGSKMLGGGMDAVLAPSDREMFGDPRWSQTALADFPAMFTYGLEGYADDRRADGAGWVSFDVGAITCPVTVLHGAEDRMVDVVNARHTAEIVPGAELVVVEGLGHFSIEPKILPEVTSLLGTGG